ncbi:hypothetical protein Salat_0235600 [Sesamum alatum]|uniref:Uncharacterized protein n=1 Tax=Sesamum alatum TaxID=300844 RepID=A0AAE2CYT0_9LAMI|nr:hypothetical protein Salat_0235600 [Sesamum alatum]
MDKGIIVFLVIFPLWAAVVAFQLILCCYGVSTGTYGHIRSAYYRWRRRTQPHPVVSPPTTRTDVSPPQVKTEVEMAERNKLDGDTVVAITADSDADRNDDYGGGCGGGSGE